MNTDRTSNSSRKRGGYYSLESGNVSHMCPPFHSICTYKHTLYKYFPTRGPISCLFFNFQLFRLKAGKCHRKLASIGSWINIASNVTMFSLFPIFEMLDNRDSESLIVK